VANHAPEAAGARLAKSPSPSARVANHETLLPVWKIVRDQEKPIFLDVTG
jgi:hypothetical protein